MEKSVNEFANKFLNGDFENAVWFKNNCPMNSSLYDDLRFADRKTGEVMYTVTPRYSHSGKAEVWGRENDFQEALVEGTWKDVKAFFGV